jgi:NAD-dependent DNA ligase
MAHDHAAVIEQIHRFREVIPEDESADWSFVDDPQPSIKFDHRKFCLTGVFAIADRSELAEIIESQGGICVNSVLKDLDYLVVGSVVSNGWSQASSGNKAQRAISERERREFDRFPGPAIITEIHFASEFLRLLEK